MSSHIYSNPKKYSKNNALQYNFAMAALSKISFDKKSRVLDIGCGDGLITNEVAKIVTEGCVIGTDISSSMIEFATKEYISQNHLRFLQMDASQNIFREQFDIIISFNCLHWVRKQQEALNGISKAAIPGAQILLLLSHKKSLYHKTLDKICSNQKWNNYFLNFENPRSFFNPKLYRDMVNQSGLQVIDLIEEEMTYFFDTKEQLKDFFSAAGSQIKKIPEDRKEEFLNDFANEFLKQANCDEDELIPVSFWCLCVTAKKPSVKLEVIKTNEDKNNYPLAKL